MEDTYCTLMYLNLGYMKGTLPNVNQLNYAAGSQQLAKQENNQIVNKQFSHPTQPSIISLTTITL